MKHMPRRRLTYLLIILLSACGFTPAIEQSETAPTTEQPTSIESPEPTNVGTSSEALPEPTIATTPEPTPLTTLPDSLQLTEEERRKTVIFHAGNDASGTPNPWTGSLSLGLHQAMIEPFFIENFYNREPEPWLAETMTSTVAMDSWFLTIREGITWNDGIPMTSDDIFFTFNLLINPESPIYRKGLDDTIETITVIDEHRLRFDLSKPYPGFQLYTFTSSSWTSPVPIVPKHIWEDQDPKTFTNYDPEQGWPVFTGAYRLKSIENNVHIYERDANWWGFKTGVFPQPKPERLMWVATDTTEDANEFIVNNHIDAFATTLPYFLQMRTQNPQIETWFEDIPFAAPAPHVQVLRLNHLVEPWNDKELRWAINFGIDRTQIVDRVYNGMAVPARFFFANYPPLEHYEQLAEDAGLYTTYPVLVSNPARTKQILEAKGYSLNEDGLYELNGEVLSLPIQCVTIEENMTEACTLLAIQLKNAGINATTEILPYDAFNQNWLLGNYTAQIFHVGGSVVDPWKTMNSFNTNFFNLENVRPIGETAPGNTGIRWKHDEYNAYIDEMGQYPLNDERIEAPFLGALEIWLDELPVIPIMHIGQLVVHNTTYWKNWPQSENPYIQIGIRQNSTIKIIHNLEPAQ